MSKSKSEILIPVSDLKDMGYKTFQLEIDGVLREAFLFRKGDKFFAYLNECRHLPVRLDLSAPTLFNRARTAFQCHQHGALYHFETGHCFQGPCGGESLRPLKITQRGKTLVVSG